MAHHTPDIHVTIDFWDDVFYGQADWDEARLRALIAGYAERGVAALHWMAIGGIDGGLWDAGSYGDLDGKGLRFIRAVPDPLPVVCDEAHRRGLRVCAVLKPHDLAIGMPYASYPLGKGPQPPVGLPHLAGTGTWSMRWLRRNPHVRYHLHPSLIPQDSGKPIRTIRVWHESAERPEPLAELEIWVSDDNGAYRPYDGPAQTSHAVRTRRPPLFVPAPNRREGDPGDFFCIELGGLDIRQPFVCLFPRQPFGLANTLAALVEVEDADGQPVATTFGLAPYQPNGEAGHDWRQVGIAFDTSRRTLLPGRGKAYSAGRARLCLADRLQESQNGEVAPGGAPREERVILGLARGRNTYLTAPVDLAHPAARDWVLGLVDAALAAGVDAVDIRGNTHTESLDWENYGYSEPALAEFRRRHGVDAAAEPFDLNAWQELRGDYFDAFLEETARRVHRRGAKLYAHLLPQMERPSDWPEGAAFLNQRWNWRRWVGERWIDGLTLKSCPLGSTAATEAMAVCRQNGCATLFNHKAFGDDPEAAWVQLIDQAQAAGIDTVNLYESADFVRLQADGRLAFSYPRLWDRVAGARRPQNSPRPPSRLHPRPLSPREQRT
jgi:hypothetical protein